MVCSPPAPGPRGFSRQETAGGGGRFLLQGVFPQLLTCGLCPGGLPPGHTVLASFPPRLWPAHLFLSSQCPSRGPDAPLGLILFSRLLTSPELVRGSCRPRSCGARLSVGAPGKEPEAAGRVRFLHGGPAPQEAGPGREGAHVRAAGTAQSSAPRA